MFATSFICLKCLYMYVCANVRVRVCADCAVAVAPCKVHVYCVLC